MKIHIIQQKKFSLAETQGDWYTKQQEEKGGKQPEIAERKRPHRLDDVDSGEKMSLDVGIVNMLIS